MTELSCKRCGNEFDICEALDSAKCSWRAIGAIWWVCRDCDTGTHLRFERGRVSVIEIVGHLDQLGAMSSHWRLTGSNASMSRKA
jgi:hypothetical protein